MKVSTRAQTAAIWLTLTMGAGIVVLHIAYALVGFSLYRDQHLGAALVYAREGIDLLRPIIVGFNANNAPTPQEFPLWQAAASVPLRWFGEWFGWANVVSLLFFFTACFPVYQLGKQSGTSATGWWTLALLLSQPLIWFQAGQAGTDGTSIAAAIWFFYSGYMALNDRRRYLWTAAAGVTGALAATLKLPFMMASGIALGIILMFKHRHDARAWAAIGFVGVFSATVFAVWTRYADSCLALAEFPYVDLRLSHNPEMFTWYFGDWSYRSDPSNWIKGGWRALNCLFGSFALVALPVAAIGLGRVCIKSAASLAGAFVTTAIFAHLVLHHSNYYLMYSLPVALTAAPLAEGLWSRVRVSWRGPSFLLIIALLGTVLLSVLQGLIGMEAVAMDRYKMEVARKIRAHTSDNDRLLMIGGGWGGDYFFLSDRSGLSIWSDNWLAKEGRLERLQQLGYNKLVAVSESPVLAAQQKTNLGGETYQRRTHSTGAYSLSAGWPTVFADEDLLIREIPKKISTERTP